MERQTLIFAVERETKNTVRYQEEAAVGKPPVIGTLYVQRRHSASLFRNG